MITLKVLLPIHDYSIEVSRVSYLVLLWLFLLLTVLRFSIQLVHARLEYLELNI